MSLQHLKSVLSTAGEHLGDLVWWQLTDAEIERVQLESLWAQSNLDLTLLPEVPTAEKTLKTSIREAQTGHPDYLLRFGKEDSKELLFAVVHEHRQLDGTLSYTQEARIKLDRIHGQLVSSHPSHDMVAAVQTAFDRLRTLHTADDVRRAIVRTLKSFSAVPLRESGGIYWVPRTFADQLRDLQQAVEAIGSSIVYLLPIHESSDAARTLGQVAQASVEEELATLRFEIEGFLEVPPDRPSTLIRRLEAFETLRTKAALYRDILKVHVTDLESQLAVLTASVEQLLDGKFAA